MERWVLHCDCNSFYASVECALDPSLGDGPLAVGGDESARHGIILAKNEAAKKFGVQTAETIWQAKRKCPSLKIVPPHHKIYQEFSVRINRIYADYTDLVEPFGLDESFLDVSGTLHLFGGDPVALADSIRQRIRKEVGITISVGVSFNKTFAKLGSDMKKPDATTFLPKEVIPQRVYPLPVGDLLYVGKSSAQRLARLNIHTIGDLAAADPFLLQAHFGKAGISLSRAARGEENDPVCPPEEAGPSKSIGNGFTYPQDLREKEEVAKEILRLAEGVSCRLKKEDRLCATLQIGWRTPDFVNRSKQGSMEPPTRSVRALADRAMELLEAGGGLRGPIRALTLTAQQMIYEEDAALQLNFFGNEKEETDKRQEKLDDTLFALREKFGSKSISRATFLDPEEKEPAGVSDDFIPFHGPKTF